MEVNLLLSPQEQTSEVEKELMLNMKSNYLPAKDPSIYRENSFWKYILDFFFFFQNLRETFCKMGFVWALNFLKIDDILTLRVTDHSSPLFQFWVYAWADSYSGLMLYHLELFMQRRENPTSFFRRWQNMSKVIIVTAM